MKTLRFFILIAAFMLTGTIEIPAQNTNPKPDQVKLMRQFIGTWECKIGKDTISIWECTSYGDALAFTIKTKTKGRITEDARSLIGYDKENDRLIEAVVAGDSPEIHLCPTWFTSDNTLVQILWKDAANPEKAGFKWVIEFTSAESFAITAFENGAKIFTNTFHRKKK